MKEWMRNIRWVLKDGEISWFAKPFVMVGTTFLDFSLFVNELTHKKK